jgi:tetratricopeptide (TPR) repeat protein
MSEIQKYKNDEEKQKAQYLRNKKIEEERQISKYIDDTDEYWRTALIYRSNNQYDEAIEAFRKSIACAEQALTGITDEAYRARIRAIIDSRERALKEVELKKELKRQNQFKTGRGNAFSN